MPVLGMEALAGPCHSANTFRGARLSPIKKVVPVSPLPGSPIQLQDDIQFDPSSRYVTPGSVGGFFSTRTQVLSVTLPSLHNDFYVPARGFMKRPVASNRFVPTEGRLRSSQELSPRDRLRVENDLLLLAKERLRKSMQVVPHRSEQPYLMAGFPVKLQHRSSNGLLSLPAVATPLTIMPPQPSLVQEGERSSSQSRKYSSTSVPRNGSVTSEAFLTQSTLDQQPIVMDEITVRKCPNYRSPCSLLGKDTVLELSRKFRATSLQADTLPYSLAEELVSSAPDPSLAVQVIDINKDGIVDIKEFIVVSSLSAHLYKESDVDYTKLENKLKSLRRQHMELGNATIGNIINSISKLLITPPLMESILTLVNCNPNENLAFLEYLCVYKFWGDLENSVLDEELTAEKLLQKDVNDYVTSYVGSSDSTFSFDDLVSSTDLL
ncbi:uncharacterized protein LOC134812022 isoform X2 [Bolinopsis microptera]|uniref:uncharacterized protein LOC134812022 isoform X2 n=1 Tax=Bolinopsis microptera TaxID=2820187 RepID=UPI00307AA682